MMKPKHLCGLLAACVVMAGTLRAMDLSLPFDPMKIADKARSAGLPPGVTVTDDLGTLKISAPAGVQLPETVTLEENVTIASQLAGRDVLVKIKLSGKDFRIGDGKNGITVTIAGSAVSLPQGNYSWRTVSVKVKCPAGGKLPITIGVRNFSGTLMLKEPIAHIDLPRSLPKGFKPRRK